MRINIDRSNKKPKPSRVGARFRPPNDNKIKDFLSLKLGEKRYGPC